MSDLKLEIDASVIAKEFGSMKDKVEKSINLAVGGLAAATHAKAMQLATEQLTVTASIYKDALSFEKIDSNIWVVSLDMKKAGWIEENRKSGFMDELLRGKSAKTSKAGKKYAIIPFKHNKNPQEQMPVAQALANDVKDFLRSKKIPYKKLEFNADGSPKMGLLHKFDILNDPPSAKAKNPALKGLSIYQRKGEDGKVRKEIMTFRIITEDHKAEGLWHHPGRKGVKIIDQCWQWASQEWDSSILPSVLEKFKD